MEELAGAVAVRFLTGPEQGRRLSIPEGTSCTLGRGQDADLTVFDTEMSRRHTTLERSQGELWVQDLGSKNGTYLGGRRLESGQRVPWRPRSAVVEVGYSRIALELPDIAALETEAGAGLSRAPQPRSSPPSEPIAVTETTSTSGRGAPIAVPPQLGLSVASSAVAPASPGGDRGSRRLDGAVLAALALALLVSLGLVVALLVDFP